MLLKVHIIFCRTETVTYSSQLVDIIADATE